MWLITYHVVVATVETNYQYRIASNFREVKIRYFRGQADLYEMLTWAWLTGMYKCSASNEIFTHENHCFPDKRIFYPTKITRYTIQY